MAIIGIPYFHGKIHYKWPFSIEYTSSSGDFMGPRPLPRDLRAERHDRVADRDGREIDEVISGGEEGAKEPGVSQPSMVNG